ncbi:hypothetical protein RB195_018548 [Necator americanus]|uniref:Uncharacterized protein n=1 Tax=Necator americanus TaxID=51031 RepID=A0ABR1CCK2_NECAM
MAQKDKSLKMNKTTAAAVYFMEWTSTALIAYANTINEIYSIPLIEHCTKKNTEVNKGKVELEKSLPDSKLTEKGEHDQLVARLRESASKVTEWSDFGCDQTANIRNKECGDEYIGETARLLCIRINEHLDGKTKSCDSTALGGHRALKKAILPKR